MRCQQHNSVTGGEPGKRERLSGGPTYDFHRNNYIKAAAKETRLLDRHYLSHPATPLVYSLTLPEPGDWCACCKGHRFRTREANPGWRCWACHPPVLRLDRCAGAADVTGRPCSLCARPDLAAIEAALAAGTPLRAIAATFAITPAVDCMVFLPSTVRDEDAGGHSERGWVF